MDNPNMKYFLDNLVEKKMKTKKNVINGLCGEVTTITTRLYKLNKFICKELYNIDNTEREQILKERDAQIDYLSILIQRIAYETELFLNEIKQNPLNFDEEPGVKPKENTTDNKSKWIIYTDDPQFEGKTEYFKKFLAQGVCFTDDMANAKKYNSYPDVLKDMDIIRIKYGIECFDKIIQNERLR